MKFGPGHTHKGKKMSKEQLDQLEQKLDQLKQDRQVIDDNMKQVRLDIRACKLSMSARSAAKREYDKRRRLQIKNVQSLQDENDEMTRLLTNEYQLPKSEVMEITPKPELNLDPPMELTGKARTKWKQGEREQFNVSLYNWTKDENARLKLIVQRERMKAKTLKLLEQSTDLFFESMYDSR